jgi:AraC-like DNA-binding protein
VLAEDYLTLEVIRLVSPQEWTHQQEGLSFFFPEDGEGLYLSGSITQNLSAREVLVANRNHPARIRPPIGGSFSFRSFSLAVEHLYPLFAHTELSWLQNVTSNLKTIRLYRASTPFAAECHRMVGCVPLESGLNHRGHLLCLAAFILAEEFKKEKANRGASLRIEDRLIQVFERLSTADLLALPAEELAAQFGCSRRHLNRLFHRYFGFSVSGLRTELRLLKAATLLRDPAAKVVTVAQQSGFSHLGLFTTSFKRRFGNTPGKWREVTSLYEANEPAITAADSKRNRGAKRFPWIGSFDEGRSAASHANLGTQPADSRLLVSIQAESKPQPALDIGAASVPEGGHQL